MSTRLRTTAALAATALFVSVAAQAASTVDLRAIHAEANWTLNPDDAVLRYSDLFNNGNPQTGATYTGGLVAPATLYSVSGSAAGAETTPGDYTLGGQPLGQFTFSQANAGAAALLDVGGTLFNNQSHFLRMNAPTADLGVTTTLFHEGRRNFAASAAWDFVTPDAGMRYGMRLTDANIGADGFDDLISLDVIAGAGGPQLQLRRIAGSELTGQRTITDVETRSFASAVLPGYSLADVNLIAMHMVWFADTNEVSTEVELLRISGGGSVIDEIGTVSFNNRYGIFNGVDNTGGRNATRFQVGAQWSEAVAAPVPEPSTYALMALRLAGVGAAALRRRNRWAGSALRRAP